MQPLVKDGKNVRFKANLVVRRLLDASRARGFGLNQLLVEDFPRSDIEQFYQLLGYDLNGYEELTFVSDRSIAAARRHASRLLKAPTRTRRRVETTE